MPAKPRPRTARVVATPPNAGVRERGRLERLQRIKDAAAKVFKRDGFDGATMREIAAEAGVATGTLFIHARDKGELLLMVLNDDLERLTQQPFTHGAGTPLLKALTSIFRTRYVYWGRDPELSLHALEESQRVRRTSDSDQAVSETARYQAQRASFARRITALIAEKQRLGEVRADCKPETVTRLITDVFLTEIRTWLRLKHAADVDKGVAQLSTLLQLIISGIAAEPVPVKRKRDNQPRS